MEVERPDGSTEYVDQFGSDSEALEWITNKSEKWLPRAYSGLCWRNEAIALAASQIGYTWATWRSADEAERASLALKITPPAYVRFFLASGHVHCSSGCLL